MNKATQEHRVPEHMRPLGENALVVNMSRKEIEEGWTLDPTNSHGDILVYTKKVKQQAVKTLLTLYWNNVLSAAYAIIRTKL